VLLAIAAVAVVAAAVVVAVLALGSGPPKVRPGAILVRPLDTPFTTAGAVFDIDRVRTVRWAVDLRQRPARPGRKWITVAAATRNVNRANFHPRALGYRVRTASGIVIGPESAKVPALSFATDGRLGKGQRASVHLGFQVPEKQVDFSLEFDPGPGSPRIRVPLG